MKGNEYLDHVERFGAISKEYLDDLNGTLKLAGGNGLYFYQKKLELILANLKKPPERILDFGCAVGLLTRLLAAHFRNSEVRGYDPSSQCIAEAISDRLPQFSNLNFLNRKEELGEKFDLIVVAGVFHHIPREEKLSVMKSISTLLSDGGKCFLFEHNPMGPMGRLILAFSPLDKGADLQTMSQSIKLFQDSEIKVVKREYISFFPPFLKPLLPLEKSLTRVPLGAQYMLVGEK